MALGFARITDRVMTAKGPGIIVSGSSNAFIENLPASRVADIAIIPKGIATIIRGSSTVFINSLPAARLLDITIPYGIIISAASKTTTI